MKEFWERFFNFLKELLPTFLLGYGIGRKGSEEEKELLKRKIRESELESEKLKNKIKVEHDHAGKSDLDIVNEITGEGRSDK